MPARNARASVLPGPQPWFDRDDELSSIFGFPPRWRITAIAPLRGLPRDVSAEVAGELGREDCVGHAWPTLDEAQGYEGEGSSPERFVRHTLPQLRCLGPPGQVRLVFAFDCQALAVAAPSPLALDGDGAPCAGERRVAHEASHHLANRAAAPAWVRGILGGRGRLGLLTAGGDTAGPLPSPGTPLGRQQGEGRQRPCQLACTGR